MITFNQINGKTIVTVDGKQYGFSSKWHAWEFIFSIRFRHGRAIPA